MAESTPQLRLTHPQLVALATYCASAAERLSRDSLFALTLRSELRFKPASMEEIGYRFRSPITKQRVHQLLSASFTTLGELEASAPPNVFSTLRADIRAALGNFCTTSEVAGLRRRLAGQLRAFKPSLGAWTALPFKVSTQPREALFAMECAHGELVWSWSKTGCDDLAKALDSIGRTQVVLRDPDFDALASSWNLSPGARKALPLLIAKFRPVLGAWLYWGKSYEAKAEALLTLKGLPISMAELTEAIRPGDPLDLRRRVLEDTRFKRINVAGDVVLRSWPGYDEYRSARQAAVSLVTASAEPMGVRDIAQDLQVEFGVSSSSAVKAIHALPDAAKTKVARSGRTYQPFNLVNVGGRPHYRITVTPDLLRGSGKYVAESYFRSLGLTPGASGTLEHDSGEVSFGWVARDGSRPFLGSLRKLLERLNARVGHSLYIHITPELSLEAFIRSEERAARRKRLPG